MPLQNPNLSDDMQKSIEEMYFMSLRIEKIVRGLKLFSRSGISDSLVKYSLGRILLETISMCEPKLKLHEVNLRYELPDQDVILVCRPTEISQILTNLLSNASDAVASLPDRNVNISFHLSDERVRVRITDSGKGIPQELLQQIMRPFFTTKDVDKGTGLGLSISKGIAESHHGDLYYELDGEFTSFVLDLPVAS